MKNRLLILTLLIASFSCTDNDVIIENDDLNQDNIVQIADLPELNLKTLTPRTTWHDDGTVWGCWGLPEDCLPDVNVTYQPSIWEIIYEIMYHGYWPEFNWTLPYILYTGPGYTTTYSNIADHLNANYEDCCDIFGNDVVDGLIEGNYTLTIRADKLEDNVYRYYLIIKQGNDVVIVYQYTH